MIKTRYQADGSLLPMTLELKEPFSDYARGNGITCPTAADAVRFLKEYEERLYQELLP